MTSHKRQQANRRNAQYATGPKTEAGKRVASQNAVQHRLSVSLSPSILDPLREQVASLLLASDVAADQTSDLAEKIIEFERNMAAFRRLEGDWLARQPGRAAPLSGGKSCYDLPTDEELLRLANLPLEGNNPDFLCKAYNAMQRNLKDPLKLKTKVNRQSAARLERYLRRAYNQLIKALRRID